MRILFVIDEASTVFRRSLEIREGSDVLADNFVLDREFGLGYLLISQRIEDMAHNVIANCSKRIIVGGLGFGIDYQLFGSSAGLSREKIESLKKRTSPGQACIFDYRRPEAFTLVVPYFNFNKNVSAAVVKERARQFSLLVYDFESPADAAPNGKDTQENFASSQPKATKPVSLSAEAKLILNYLSVLPNSLTPQTSMFIKLNIISGAKRQKLKAELLDNNWIKEHQLQVQKTKLNFWEVTAKAREAFDLPESKMAGKGGFLHQLIGYHLHLWARQHEYQCRLEAQIGNNKAVDALLVKDNERLLFEICISEPLGKELNNIFKDISSGFEFSKLIFLTPDTRMLKKLEAIIAGDLMASPYLDKIEVKLAGNYIVLK